MKTVVVIMAGGRGERFWPYSRQNRPKQFVSLTEDGRTLIQCTMDRISPIASPEDVLVVTGEAFADIVRQQLPELPVSNILCEPRGRNTAPCIGFAATVVQKRYGDAIMVVLPSDHLLREETIFIDSLRRCIRVAERSGCLLTLGITPSYPETGYGYIQYGEAYPDAEASGIYRVRRFVEKPDMETAKRYLAEGQYLWNSGMFVFSAKSIMEHFMRFLPEHHALLNTLLHAVDTPLYHQTLVESFDRMQPVSIDYGIMEKSDDILTLPGGFGWDDVGSWNAISRIRSLDASGNVLSGNVICDDTENCILLSGERPMVTLGLQNVVAVDCGDVVFICNKDSTQQIKQLLVKIQSGQHKDIL